MSDELEQNYVELTDEEGKVTKCEIYDVVDFEEKTYAILMPLEADSEEDGELIVMEYVEEDEDGFFQNIEDDEEFERVCDYIESLADDVED